MIDERAVRGTFSPALRRLAGALSLATITGIACAQGTTANDVRTAVEEAAVSVEAEFACDIAISGEPVHREFSGKWELAFFANGMDCDGAYEELQRRVASSVVLYRRPGRERVNALIVDLLWSARSFGCQIALRGQPSFDERSGEWVVPYFASGNGCDEASDSLRDAGAELQISFWSRGSRQDLIR